VKLGRRGGGLQGIKKETNRISPQSRVLTKNLIVAHPFKKFATESSLPC